MYLFNCIRMKMQHIFIAINICCLCQNFCFSAISGEKLKRVHGPQTTHNYFVYAFIFVIHFLTVPTLVLYMAVQFVVTSHTRTHIPLFFPLNCTYYFHH